MLLHFGNSIVKMKAKISKYKKSIEKGIRWLLAHQKANGAIMPEELGINSYYKVPLAFQIAGYPHAALKGLNYIAAKDFNGAGDFSSPDRRRFHREFYGYANCWLTIAAQELGRFDLSGPAFNFIIKFQDPTNGGFCSRRPYRRDGKNRQDLLSTSFGGLAALKMKRIDVARKAGNFLIRMKELQPCPEKVLYGTLIADSHSAETLREDKSCMVFKGGDAAQRYWFPGIASAFLAQLFRTTRNQADLDHARWYLNFWSECGENAFRSTRSGKAALGAAFLYAVTGEEKFRALAFRIADFLTALQRENGMWPGVKGGDPASSLTSEFVVWLSEIVHACDEKSMERRNHSEQGKI